MGELCPHCRIEFDSFYLNPINGRFRLANLKFRYEEKDYTELDWKAHEISGDISIYKLLFLGDIYLGKILVSETEVRLFDGDGTPSQNQIHNPSPSFFFVLKGLEVKNAKFIYTNQIQGHLSVLTIPYVSATLGELGNTPELKFKSVEAIGRGSVEKSGEVVMKINTYVFDRPPLYVDIDIESTAHDLSDLTPFFKAYAGISLKGFMRQGQARVQLRADHVKTWIRSKFENFDVTLNKMYDRSQAQSFFLNLGSAILFETKNTNKKKADQIRSIEATQNKGESVPAFILRSLKEAAIKVVKA